MPDGFMHQWHHPVCRREMDGKLRRKSLPSEPKAKLVPESWIYLLAKERNRRPLPAQPASTTSKPVYGHRCLIQ